MLASDQVGQLTAAYGFLNDVFFEAELPDCMLTMHRHPKAVGYLAPDRFTNINGRLVAELALNPDHFDRGEGSQYLNERRVVSTLLHEMVHLWQKTQPDPPRRGYHDKRFAAKMRECGLQTSDTAAPGGHPVGQSMRHYILEHGRFDIAFRAMKKLGFRLEWRSGDILPAPVAGVIGVSSGTVLAPRVVTSRTKTKYSCLLCGANCWGKPGMILACAGTQGHMHEPGLMGIAA